MSNVIQAITATLYAPIWAWDTTVSIRGLNTIYWNQVEMIGSVMYGTIEPTSSTNSEIISWTGITVVSDNIITLTGVTRWLPAMPGETGVARSHAGNVVFILSDNPQVWNTKTSIDEVETITEEWTFTGGVKSTTTPTVSTDLATKWYVDWVAIAGAPDSSTATKGITKLDTAPASPTNPIAIGVNSPAFIGGGTLGTPGSGNKMMTQTGLQAWSELYGTDSGWDDAYVVALTPTLTSYTTGQSLFFKPSTTNTGACTVDFWPWVKNIKTKDWNDPQNGVIRANMIVEVFYDGTNFVLATEDFATTANNGVVQLATSSETLIGSNTSKVPPVSAITGWRVFVDNVAGGTVVNNATTTVLTKTVTGWTFSVGSEGIFRTTVISSHGNPAWSNTFTITFWWLTLYSLVYWVINAITNFDIEIRISVISNTRVTVIVKVITAVWVHTASISSNQIINDLSTNQTFSMSIASASIFATWTYYTSSLIKQ